MLILLWFAFAAFVFFAMDIRPKAAAIPFVPSPFIGLMKLCCIALFVGYAFSLYKLPSATLWLGKVPVALAALLTSLGAGLVAWAKIALGKSFTWTGYHLSNAPIVHHGPYRWLRHPLYCGVFLFEAGAAIIFIQSLVVPSPHPVLLLAVALPLLIYAVGFNLTMACKETKDLSLRARASAQG